MSASQEAIEQWHSALKTKMGQTVRNRDGRPVHVTADLAAAIVAREQPELVEAVCDAAHRAGAPSRGLARLLNHGESHARGAGIDLPDASNVKSKTPPASGTDHERDAD